MKCQKRRHNCEQGERYRKAEVDEKTKLASELIAELQALVAQYSDLPVMVALPDEGSFAAETPRFDTDGAGDDCFIM